MTSSRSLSPRALLPVLALSLAACGDDDEGARSRADSVYSVGAIVQSNSDRTLFVYTTTSLDHDLDPSTALEVPGNSRHWAYEGAVYVALAESPEIVKYVPDDTGALIEEGRVSFATYGLTAIPAGNAFISPTKAYLFSDSGYEIILWNPTEMTIATTISLASLQKPNLSVELHMAVTHGDRVYVPVRYANFASYYIEPSVNVLVVDSQTDQVLGLASDARCVAAGTPTIATDGTVYVAADGRSFLAQIVSMQKMETPAPTCILRMPAGEVAFDPDFRVDVPTIAGGDELATSLWSVDGEVAYARLFRAADVPAGTMAYGTQFWSVPAFRTYRFTLGDDVIAEAVEGVPPSIIDFGGNEVDGDFYVGTVDASQGTTVYRIDPETNVATRAFAMQGVLREIHRLR